MALNDDWYLHPVSPWLVYQADNNQLLMEIQRELETATEPQTEQQQRECAARYNTELRRIRANFNAIREANGQEMQELNRRVAEINAEGQRRREAAARAAQNEAAHNEDEDEDEIMILED